MDELKRIKFYCWQLNINTLEQLEEFKKANYCYNTGELLQALAVAYNGEYYNKLKELED